MIAFRRPLVPYALELNGPFEELCAPCFQTTIGVALVLVLVTEPLAKAPPVTEKRLDVRHLRACLVRLVEAPDERLGEEPFDVVFDAHQSAFLTRSDAQPVAESRRRRRRPQAAQRRVKTRPDCFN